MDMYEKLDALLDVNFSYECRPRRIFRRECSSPLFRNWPYNMFR